MLGTNASGSILEATGGILLNAPSPDPNGSISGVRPGKRRCKPEILRTPSEVKKV
ncbi:MAG: hypothetical protein LBU32_31270 [Clostridiales bacterium]|jgi:hypothetical protein|nr:hypothetical protein [Clostridiales bacterium]